MADLRARAAARTDDPGATPAGPPPVASEPPAESLPEIEAPQGIDPDAADIPVHTAVVRAMRDLGKIGKADRFDAPGTKFSFRGVDRVVNAVAPILRKHGLFVMPEVRATEYRDVPRANGGRSHECVVTVAWHWIGPKGDELVAVTMGEALDTADKATSKAQAVAWRTCLIQMLAIPTGDPDPDSVLIERGEQPVPSPAAYRDEIVHPSTSLGRLRVIRSELHRHSLGDQVVVNEVGDEELLGKLLTRIGTERSGGQK